MKLKLDDGAFEPTRAHHWDAGYDLRTPHDVIVWDEDSIIVDTGVHAAIPAGHFGLVTNKSSLNFNRSVIVGEGVIDCGYTGSIKVKLYNLGDIRAVFKAGDGIAQLIIVPCAFPDIELVDELEPTERGDGGFGSTGR